MEEELRQFKQEYLQHRHNFTDGTQRVNIISFASVVLPNTQPATAANYGEFFIATSPCVVNAISCIYTTAGSSTPTLQVERLTGIQTPDTGITLLQTAFNLAATANIVQIGKLVIIPTGLNVGDRLCLKDIGTLTAIAGLVVTVDLLYATS